MNEFQFKPEIAVLYGVNEAIFLHSLSFYILKNRSNERNYHGGRYWSYDTYKALAQRFPFWSARQIERIVANCKAQGAILVGNFNEDKTDRTKWYTLAGKAEEIYFPETVECIPPDGEMVVPQGFEADVYKRQAPLSWWPTRKPAEPTYSLPHRGGIHHAGELRPGQKGDEPPRPRTKAQRLVSS